MKWTFMPLQIMHEIEQGKMTFAEMFPRAKSAGFTAYDASAWDAKYADPQQVCELCRQSGLEVADYIHWVHMTPSTEEGIQKAIQKGKQAVDTACAYGVKKLMLVEDVVPQDVEGVPRQQLIDRMVTVLRPIVAYAAKFDITVMFEDFPALSVPMCDSDECEKLLEQVPGLRLVFDTGNMLARKESPLEFYQKLKSYVIHVHLKDIEYPENTEYGHIDCDGRQMCHAQHGEGVVDFETLIPTLSQDEYNGYVTIEYSPKPDTKDHFEKMKESIAYFESIAAR